MEEEHKLTWDNFSGHLRMVFRELYDDDKYTDVTLVSDDQIQFKVHRIVLNASSPVFKKIIDNNPSSHPLIYLRGIQHQEMESILQFMYLGEGKFYQQRMAEFLRVAQDLEVKDIGKNVEIKKEAEAGAGAEAIQGKYKGENGEMKTEDVIKTEERNGDDNVTRHIDTKEQSNAVATDCPECGAMFSKKSVMLRHFRSKHRGEGIKYSCNQCDHQVTRQDYLKYHIQSKHQGIKYNCNQCDYQASRKDILRNHIQSRHEGVKYHCSQCDYSATGKGNLKQHIQSEHEGVTYPCNQCDFQAKYKGSLKQHIQAEHEGVSYPCNQCDFQAKHKGNLKHHIQAEHEGIKYPCNHCGFQSKWLTVLKNHIQSKH